MSEFLKVIVMSVIQGLTEFLPVSSSGHLALAKHFLGLESPGASLELFLHGGTLLSVIIFYRRKLLSLIGGVLKFERTSLLYALWVLLSMVPAGILYAIGGDELEKTYDSPLFVSGMICVTGALLLSLFVITGRAERKRSFGWSDALLMGLAQAIAMLPGISRSGSTIAMSLPVIGGAVLMDVLKDGVAVSGLSTASCVVGAIVAGLVGLAAIGTLVKILNKGKFWMFGVYCLVVGATSMLLISMGY